MNLLQIVLVAGLLTCCNEVVDEGLTKILPCVEVIFWQPDQSLVACLVENDREVVGHDVLVAHG